MKKTNTTERAARVSGFLIPVALVCLVLAVAVTAAPQVAPVNIDPPTITGTPRVGEVLTAQNGTWENSPTEFRYRWLRCNPGGNGCSLLAADGKTYRIGDSDLGRTLRVRVIALNADGETNARSEPTDVVGSNAAPLTTASALPISASGCELW